MFFDHAIASIWSYISQVRQPMLGTCKMCPKLF